MATVVIAPPGGAMLWPARALPEQSRLPITNTRIPSLEFHLVELVIQSPFVLVPGANTLMAEPETLRSFLISCECLFSKNAYFAKRARTWRKAISQRMHTSRSG